MKLQQLIEFINNPVIVKGNSNLGNLSDFTIPALEIALKCEIQRIEGLPNKQVVIYIK